MQLHACLLLFIITTEKTLALLHQHCGGNVSLDREPAGHINLTVPGLFTNTSNTLMNHQSDETQRVPACTWTIGIPPGQTVLLMLEGGPSLSVRCVLNEEDLVLESGGTTLLSRCDGNKATFMWTGAGRSSNEIQLSYYVQEDQRNSSEDHTSPRSDPDLLRRSQTGTSFTSEAPVGQDLVRGTDGGRGYIYEGLEWSSASSPSPLDQGLLQPTSPLQGLTAAGRADRETLPLPEEEPNNGADTSGAAHLASARERTHPSFQPTLSIDATFHTTNTSGGELPVTGATHPTASSTYTDQYTATQVDELSVGTQAQPSSSVPPLTLSPPEPPWESGTTLTPHGGAVSGASSEKLPQSWRSQRSTDVLNSDLVSTITADPLTSTQPQQDHSSRALTDTGPTASSSSSSSLGPSGTLSSITAARSVETVSFHPTVSQTDLSASDILSQTAAFESNTEMLHVSSTQSQTSSPPNTENLGISSPPDTSSPFAQTGNEDTQTTTQSTHTVNSSPAVADDEHTSRFSGFSSTAALTMVDQTSAPAGITTETETYTLRPAYTPSHDSSSTNTPTSIPVLSSSTSTPSSTLETHTTLLSGPHLTHTPTPLPSITTEHTAGHTLHTDHETTHTTKPTLSHKHPSLPSTTNVPATHKEQHNYITTTLSLTTAHYVDRGVEDVEKDDESWRVFPSSTTTQTPSAGAPSWTTSRPGQENHLTSSVLTPTTSHTSKFYIVSDRPAAIRVESIELLLQIIVEESRSAVTSGLEEDTTAWVEPYLQKAPGFSGLLGVWSSGHAVQSLVEFKTSGALQWLSLTGPTSLLERTGLAQAVCDGKSFRSSKITNITLGGLQGDVCDWLLQCPAGYKCVFHPDSSNYSCSSVCHSDHCHHHGICTHHPGQLPVCRCLVGEDFWYMGQRCDVRMTRARLVGACLAILLLMVTVIGALAFVAVRRYRAILIQAKVDQTRSSYRRFNHFDELSGRFWLRSWAGSADSLDNPAFTRSDERLHLQALDRPCCYHDDTLSLASTCPSHGTRINTIYPHSSQYGWRGSEMSMGDGVLDSGKASDLSVCSWPVEPIHWTPFPLLQQLASHRTPAVRVKRPRSYCEGMELVDLGKSWTA